MPITGCCRPRITSIRPAWSSACMAERAEPTPGSRTRSAARIRSASEVRKAGASRRRRACRTEPRLAPPESMTAMDSALVPRIVMTDSQGALGGRNPAAGPAAQGRTKRAADALEAGLYHVVGILSAQIDVQGAFERLGQGCEEMRDHFSVQAADRLAREGPVEDKGRTAGEVDGDPGQRFVHRQGEAIAADAGAIAKRTMQGLTKGECAVLDRVVLVDVQVTGAIEFQAEAAVSGNLLEHVIEESDAGRDRDRLRGIQIDFDLDPGLVGTALHPRGSRGVEQAGSDDRPGLTLRPDAKAAQAHVRGQLQVGVPIADDG